MFKFDHECDECTRDPARCYCEKHFQELLEAAREEGRQEEKAKHE